MKNSRSYVFLFVCLCLALFLFLTGCANTDTGLSEAESEQPSLTLEPSSSLEESSASSELTESAPSSSTPFSSQKEKTDLSESVEQEQSESEESALKIQISFGEFTYTAIPESNVSARAFLALLEDGSLTVQMRDYANMEKVGPLGTDLPRSDSSITTQPGDIILYQGNQITIYYDTNTWSFTKLAQIEDITGKELFQALGSGDVEVTFSLLS